MKITLENFLVFFRWGGEDSTAAKIMRLSILLTSNNNNNYIYKVIQTRTEEYFCFHE